MIDEATTALIRRQIVNQAGGFLASPERVEKVTCAVCAAPVDGYTVCRQCSKARSVFPGEVANLVGAVTYARTSHQTGHIMHGYKAPAPQQQHVTTVQLLVLDAVLNHLQCASKMIGRPVSCWTSIPSLSSGRLVHPLAGMVRPFVPLLLEASVVAAPDHRDERTVRPENFVVQNDLRGHHVLVVDDTWTSGAQAQSVAVATRRAGGAAVTILVMARWLDTNWPPTKAYMSSRKTRRPGPNFDVLQCPFALGPCP